MTTVVNHLGHTTRMAYDMLGRKIAMCDPNMGTASGVTSCTTNSVGAWVYTYSPGGDLLTQKDAKNQTLTFTYDSLGRPLTKKQGSTSLVTWTYDDPAILWSKGRVTQVVDQATTTNFAYDQVGHVTWTQRQFLGVWYTMIQNYDALNRITDETFPDGEIVTYNYNEAGWLNSVSGYINGITYNARGQKTALTYANNLTTTWAYDPNNFRPTNRTTSNNQQDLTYVYDNNGNLTSITDSLFTASRTFTYDDLNRLTTANGTFGVNQSNQNCTYVYNAIGDITNKCGTIFTYGDVMHPSAVTFNPATGKNYTYDANGNMLTRGNQTLTWDIDNRVSQISISGGGTTFMEYDYTGMRVKKNAPSGISLYPFQGYEIDPNGVVTKFIRIGVENFASKRGANKYFYHNDHLGSVNVVTDLNGARVQLNEYDPWGGVSKAVGSIDPTHRFNGKELDPESGLYYYGGRYYDPEISRFISPDPFIQAPDNPQNLNRYSYVLNNPQNLIDPSGYSWFSKLWKFVKKAWKGLFKSTIGRIFVSALVGWATGYVLGPAGFGWLESGWAIGAAGGAAAGATSAGLSGGNPLIGAFAGGAFGFIGGGGLGFGGPILGNPFVSGGTPLLRIAQGAAQIGEFVANQFSSEDERRKDVMPQAQRVWFFGVGGAAYLSSAPGGTNKGIGGELSLGLACQNWSCLFYKSTGQVELNDPYGGKVAGGSFGAGPVGGYMDGGFNTFLGESTQRSLTIGLGTYTTMESGGQTGASAGLSKGQGLSAVVVRTKTSPLKWSDFKPW